MRKHINRLKNSFLSFSLLVFVAACGGGGGGGPITGTGGTGGETAAGEAAGITLFALADANGAAVTSVSADTPTTVSFTVIDSSGTAVPNATGTFDLVVPVASGPGSQRSVASGGFTASGSGVVSVALSITDPTVAGDGTLSITLGSTTVTESITVLQVAGVPVSFAVALRQNKADTSPDITSISAANPGVVVVDLIDFNGDPVVNEIISVSTTLGDLTPGSGNVLTDSSGRASAVLAVGSAQSGEAGTLTVSVTNLTPQTINFDIDDSGTTGTIEAGEAARITLFALADANGAAVTSVSADTPTTVSFTVIDSSGTAVPNATGTFDLVVPVASGPGSQRSVASGGFTASGSGVVSVALSITDPTVAGDGTLSITLGSTTVTESITVLQVAGVPVSFAVALRQNEADTSPDITSISAANPGVVVVDLIDFNGDPVANEIISVSTTLGDLMPGSGNVLTDSSGRASAVLAVGSAQSGEAGTLTVSVTNLTPQTINFDIDDSGATDAPGFSIVVGLYDSNVDLGDLSGSTQVNTVSALSSAFFVATVTNTATGLPVESAIVSVGTTLGTITPGNGQILTNADGIAAAEIDSGANEAGAAGTLTASAGDVSATLNFSVGSVDLRLGRDSNADGDANVYSPNDFVEAEIAVSNTNLGVTGSAGLAVVIVDSDHALVSTPLTVVFASNCSNFTPPAAMLDSPVTTVNGVASSTYRVDGCEGSDTITARVQELTGVAAMGAVDIEAAVAGSIQFTSATPTTIALAGTGGVNRAEASTLVFTVVGSDGNPQENELVEFRLSTVLGGVNLEGDLDGDGDLQGASEAPTSSATGEVRVRVNSGTVPTSVRVVAIITTNRGEISAVSDTLVISTGLPDNNSFELGITSLNPGGWDETGITDEVNIFAADAFNNPVPDGTAISFTTEYGAIEPSCTTMNGICAVTWRSQSPRRPADEIMTGDVLQLRIASHGCDLNGSFITGVPCSAGATFPEIAGPLTDRDDPDFPGQVYGGRNTILAYAIGEESFIDANADGRYSWIDSDGDGCYDDGANQFGENDDSSIGSDNCNGTTTAETLERFTDLPEAFLDDNEDGVFGNEDTVGGCRSDNGTDECAGWQEGGQEETFIDFDADNEYDGDNANTTDGRIGNGIFNGVLCHPFVAATGDCTTDLVNVRSSNVLLMSGTDIFIGVYDDAGNQIPLYDAVDVRMGNQTRHYHISDVNNGYLREGTTISISAANCMLMGVQEYEVANTNEFGHTVLTITYAEDTATNAATDTDVDLVITRDEDSETFTFSCMDSD